MFLEADVYLKSDKSLEEVGEILSKELFGGLSFEGRENHIPDEIPAIYIEPEIMGLEIILIGGDIDGVCILQIRPTDYLINEKNSTPDFNFGDYVKFKLKSVPNIKVMSNIEVDEFEKKFES